MEDVTKLTKEEFLKFLNCSHHSIKPDRIVVSGPKNRKIPILKQFGKYSSCNVQLEEFSLNHQVLRIPLPRVDLQNLSTRQIALKFRSQKTEKKRKKNNAVVSRFGRKLKKPQPRTQLNILSLTRSGISTRSASKYPTRSVDKSKSKYSSEPKIVQKVEKPLFSRQIKNQPLITKPDNKKVFGKKMATWTPATKQYRPAGPVKSMKPQFIIKYVPSEPTYFLKMNAIKHPEDGKLMYPFDALVKDIKNMKLPSPTWKIKVVVKSNKIASIIFTNKCVLERTVSFNAKSEYFELVIENRPAILLGSPNAVTCVEDIEILLNIIHTISAKNPMVYYKN